MQIDKIGEKVEGLIAKINNLKYPFIDMDLQAEALESLGNAVGELENYLDLATKDSQENPEE